MSKFKIFVFVFVLFFLLLFVFGIPETLKRPLQINPQYHLILYKQGVLFYNQKKSSENLIFA